MISPLEGLCSALSALESGDRAWFWLCLDAQGVPPLLMTLLRQDADMGELRSMVESAQLSPGVQVCVGVASVTATGQLQLGGSELSWGQLLRLASWVTQNVQAHPELGRLKDLVMVNVVDGEVVQRIADAGAWRDVPEVSISGTIHEVAERLGKLAPGRDAWFWLSEQGPDGDPFLALGNARKDAQGASFAESISALRRRSPSGGEEITGILRVGGSGGVTLLTEGALEATAAVLERLSQSHQGLEMLGRARLVRLEAGRLAQILVLPRVAAEDDPAEEGEAEEEELGPDLSAQARELERLSGGEVEEVWFWFTNAAQDGLPMLLLSTDRDALKPLALAAGGEGQTLRGRVTSSGKGWLHFQSRETYEGFLSALAGWAGMYHARWSALGHLRGARLTCTDRDGNVVAREKDDAVWAAALS